MPSSWRARSTTLRSHLPDIGIPLKALVVMVLQIVITATFSIMNNLGHAAFAQSNDEIPCRYGRQNFQVLNRSIGININVTINASRLIVRNDKLDGIFGANGRLR